jgi:hypothetical protein
MNFKELTQYFIEEKEFTNFKEIKDGKEKESIGTDSTFSDFVPREKSTDTKEQPKESNKKPAPKKDEKKDTKKEQPKNKKHDCPECKKLKKICPKCKKEKEKKRTLKEEIQYQSNILLEKRKYYDDVSFEVGDDEGEEDLNGGQTTEKNFPIKKKKKVITDAQRKKIDMMASKDTDEVEDENEEKKEKGKEEKGDLWAKVFKKEEKKEKKTLKDDIKEHSIISGNFNLLTESEIILTEGIKRLKISKSLFNLKQKIERKIEDETDKEIVADLLKEIDEAIVEFKKKEQEYKMADASRIDKSKIKQDYRELQKKYKKILSQTTSSRVKSVLKKIGIGALVTGVIGGLTIIFGHSNTGQKIWNNLMMYKLDKEEEIAQVLYKVNKELNPSTSVADHIQRTTTRIKNSIDNTIGKVPKEIKIKGLQIDKALY